MYNFTSKILCSISEITLTRMWLRFNHETVNAHSYLNSYVCESLIEMEKSQNILDAELMGLRVI